MSDGFFGQILRVDLSKGTVERQALPPDLYRNVLGGYGLGAGYSPTGSHPAPTHLALKMS